MTQASAPLFSNADFTAAYMALMPRGRVWPRDVDAFMPQVIATFAPTYERQTLDLANLLSDAFPVVPVQLLYEWEQTLGLPNPYAGAQTISQRQSRVAQKFAKDGGQSVPYFLSILSSYGFSGVTISEYAPFRTGYSTAGYPCYGAGWAFVWLVTAPNISVSYFTAGSAVNTALYELGGVSEIEYVISEFAPAHTIPLFAVA